jgi:ATP-dependent RNA helicase DDX10/DBP4
MFLTYGNLNQHKRIQNLIGFSKSKKGILFSTDIMSCGIDFLSIDWVIQLDCPPNIETYLHRIGRTGRLSEIGKTILLLNKFEIKFLKMLHRNSIQISLIYFSKTQILRTKEIVENMIKKDKTLFFLAQSAFFTYLRFIFLQNHREILDVKKIIWEEILGEFGIKTQSWKDKVERYV